MTQTRILVVLALFALAGVAFAATAEPAVVPALQETGGGWASILPPLVAIGLALAFRNVIPALFAGVLLGAWLIEGLTLPGLGAAVLSSFHVHVHGALVDEDHAFVILFSLMIGGMVGIVLKNGGMLAVVQRITTWASTRKRGQLATSWLGIGIFFDDYANSLVVGNTMRPITDRLRISREKLAYLVDSTAAPVACIAFVTTWIGMEVGLVGDGLEALAEQGKTNVEGHSGYGLFLSSVAYSFYPWLAIFFVFVVAWSGRDFGAMLGAERRAQREGKLWRDGASIDDGATGEGVEVPDGKPLRMINAVLPVVVLVATVLVALYTTGSAGVQAMIDGGADVEMNLRTIIGEADSYAGLMWGAILSVLTAALLTLSQRILTLDETVQAWYGGVKSILYAMVILVLAWALSGTLGELGTAEFLRSRLGDTLSPWQIPPAVFLLSAVIAFSTGSSWSTMSILMPLVFPLAWEVLEGSGVAQPGNSAVLHSTISCVLAGAVWGDHCSPISDTTILSSMVSGCDHVDHVRTQLPYALLVGLVGLGLGVVPAALGAPWWLAMLACAGVLVVFLRVFGRVPETATS